MSYEVVEDSYKKIVRLSDNELAQLWETYFADRSNKAIRDKLIVQYIYLTRYVVGRIKVNIPQTFSYEDVVSYGVEGLIDAIERYAPNKGAKFETYALVRIKGSIIDKVRSQDFLPRSVRRKIKQIHAVTEKLRQQLGRTPTTAEVAEFFDTEPEKIEKILAQDVNISSIYDKKGTAEDSVEIIDSIADEKNQTPDELMEKKDSKNELEHALKRLPEREKMLLVLYYQQNMTLKEIGEIINVSESRVCQLHSQAIMKLRNILSSKRTERLSKSIV